MIATKEEVKRYPLAEARNYKHGDCPSGRAPSVEYQSWYAMKGRIANPRNKAFANYGGRGIRICDRWLNSYAAFLADMGRKPSPRCTLDRKDNDGDYTPSNCRWATKREQVGNMRKSVLISHQGETLCASEWARRTGLHVNTILYRVKVRMAPARILQK